MVDAARLVVRDNTDRILRSIDVSGNPQKENSPGTQARKRARYGHSIPLVADRELVSWPNWRLNGRRYATPQNARPPRFRVRIEVPAIREDVIPGLVAKGYRPPVGVSLEIRERMREVIGRAFEVEA